MNKFFVFFNRNYGFNRVDTASFITLYILLFAGGYKHWLVWLALGMFQHRQSACKLCREDLHDYFRKVYDGFAHSIILYFGINLLVKWVSAWIDHGSIF